MPRWKDIAQSKEYQSLDQLGRLARREKFWQDVIKKSPKFKKMSRFQRKKLRNTWDRQAIIEEVRRGWERPEGLTGLPIKGLKLAGRGVEKVAKFIEPSERELAYSRGVDLPFMRQLAAEYARFYKPEYVLTGAAAGKLLGAAAKPVGRFISKRTPAAMKQTLAKVMTVGKGQPKAYQELAQKTHLERLAGAREAQTVAKTLSEEPFTGRILTGKEQRIVGKIFRGEAETIRKLPKYQKYSHIAKQGREIMDKWSRELVKSGIPKKSAEEAIDKNIGRYMARMYRSKLAKGGNFFTKKNIRLRLEGLKHRKELSAAVLRRMGEIKEPALPTATRVKQLSETAANAKLFKTVAKNPEWVAKTNITGNMIKMPNSPALGALRNKWVINEIGEDINAIIEAKAFSIPIYSKALEAWKFGKVVLNPATHSRNIMSNSILLDLSGVSHARQAKLLPRVARDYLRKGKVYQQAVKHGAIGDEFVGGEIARIRDTYLKGGGSNLERLMRVVKKPFQKAADIYQAEEQLAKMIKFTDMLERGATPEVAAREAQKWLFNYSRVPKFVEGAKHIAPFATFTYKAIPRVAEAITTNPLRVYKYYALFKSWNEAARKSLGMDEKEFKGAQKALPPWYFRAIGDMPLTLLMPWRDKNNDLQWYNLEYTLPLGMAPEIIRKGFFGGFVGNPVLTIVGELRANRDFKGSPIVPVGATKAEMIQKVTEYIYRQVAPSLAPAIPPITKGGYSFEKIVDAIMKRPDYAGRVRELPTTLLDTLAGIKISPLNIREAKMFKVKELQRNIQDLQMQMMRVQSHRGISAEEKLKNRIEIKRKIERLLEKYREE